MRKIFTLAVAVLASFSLMADDFVLADTTFAEDKMTATVEKQIFILSAAHGGPGSATYADYGAHSIKLAKQTIYKITLPYGFKPTKVNIKGYSNDNSNSSIDEFNGVAQSEKTFLARNTADIKTQACVTTGYDFALEESATDFSFKTGAKQVCVLITISGTPADCTAPSLVWGAEPQGGKVGDPDFEATANATPAEVAIVWTTSNPEVATVTNGTIHYVAPGVVTITASLTYSGTDYCPMTVSVSKNIAVYLNPIVPATNDRVWYFPTELPNETTGSGLNYAATSSSNGLFGIKLNSGGNAWFAKPAVAGKLRVGAYYKDANTAAYEVNVFACNETGESQGNALGTLSTAAAGQASSQLAIEAAVERIRIERKTNSEGILYFIEFCADGGGTALDNTAEEVKAVKTFENGQLVIIKNGIKYNATGAVVK